MPCRRIPLLSSEAFISCADGVALASAAVGVTVGRGSPRFMVTAWYGCCWPGIISRAAAGWDDWADDGRLDKRLVTSLVGAVVG